MRSRKAYTTIVEAINDISDEINRILNDRQTDKYFDGIVLLYSFIENLLKWLVFVKLLWDKSSKELSAQETKAIAHFCKNLTLFSAQQMALSIAIVRVHAQVAARVRSTILLNP